MEPINEYVHCMERDNNSKKQLDAYLQWKIDRWTVQSMYHDTKAIGVKNGLDKGIINLVNEGYSIENISNIIGLTPEQITEILKR